MKNKTGWKFLIQQFDFNWSKYASVSSSYWKTDRWGWFASRVGFIFRMFPVGWPFINLKWSEVKWSEVKWSEVKLLSRVWLFAIPWTVVYQASLSMGFSRQEYWSALPFPSPGDLPDTGIEPGSPTLQADTLPSEPPGKPLILVWDPQMGYTF